MQHLAPRATNLLASPAAIPAGQGSSHRGRVLIVDDDRRMASQTAQWLCREGFHASAVATSAEAIAAVSRERFDVCLLDLGLPDDGSGDVVATLGSCSPLTAVVGLAPPVTSGKPSLPSDATVPWPSADAVLLDAIAAARRHATARTQSTAASSLAPAMVGGHASMQGVLDVVGRVAHTTATILITGETGTGKSHLARTIHEMGRVAGGPSGRFVEVACGAVHEGLLESELFGHVAGAFTGAVRDRAGRFLEAHRGTIFLDEIATASPAMQVKLLRVLQEQRFEPVGGSQTHEVDARVILATHEDLAGLVAAGRFREDLYWRINVVAIEMPPLRERGGDILLLASHFLGDAVAMAVREVDGFSAEAREALLAHDWPGNVRELEHAVRRAVLLGSGRLVELHDLPPAIQAARGASPATLKNALESPERQLILDALARHGWCRHAAARALGINRTSLYKKFKRLGIDVASLGGPR